MIQKKEFIGKQAEIEYNNKKFKGMIIDETKNMIYLETQEKIVKIIKQNSKITINKQTIDGKKLIRRPEDRIKV